MNIKFILLGVLLLLGITLSIYQFQQLNLENDDPMDREETKLYQGPVPNGYDEEYFRKTGITKPIEKEN